MKIRFLNQQDKYRLTLSFRRLIKRAAKATLQDMHADNKVEISVVLTDNSGIQALNALHRNIDRPTDVLSFPMFEYDKDKNPIQDMDDIGRRGNRCLGDIVISLERAAEQAEEYGHTLTREVTFLTVHSMLHLLGYDHMTPDEEAEMFGYQREILNRMGILR